MPTLLQLQEESATLSALERAGLATYLIQGLTSEENWVSDEEVTERARQMKSGEVTPLTMDQLKSAIEADRRSR